MVQGSFKWGDGDIKYLSNEEKIWITSGIDSNTDRFHESGLCVTQP